MFDRELTIPPPDLPLGRPPRAGPVKQGRRPPRQRLVLDRAEHGGILPSGRKPTTPTNHPVTLLRCPSYWGRYTKRKHPLHVNVIVSHMDRHICQEKVTS